MKHYLKRFHLLKWQVADGDFSRRNYKKLIFKLLANVASYCTIRIY